MTYFHGRAAHYHRRVGVSRSCSGWEGVVPPSYGRQAVKGWVAKPEGLGHRDSDSRSTGVWVVVAIGTHIARRSRNTSGL